MLPYEVAGPQGVNELEDFVMEQQDLPNRQKLDKNPQVAVIDSPENVHNDI